MSQLTLADCWPRRFSPSSLALQFCEDPTQAEQPLFAKASAGEAVAQLWQAPQGLVVPGSYRQFTDLPAVSAHFAARGWPVWLRRSGGGLVPQGPGIINLSLAWPVQQPLGEAAEPIYHSLCAVLQRTLARFGVASHPRAGRRTPSKRSSAASGSIALTRPLLSRSCFPASAICCPALARRWRRSWTRLAEGRFQVAAEGFHRARHARSIGPNDV